MKKEINELKKILSQDGLSKSDIINLMSQVRNIIEEKNYQEKYKHLNLYCNWCFHTKISGSIVCFRMIKKLTEIMVEHDAIKNDVIHEVTDVLSVPILRKEFISLFNEFNIPDLIFKNREIWKDVFGIIASILLERPLSFPEYKVVKDKPKIKQIYDETKQIAFGTNLFVTSFSFYEGEKKRLWWKIKIEKEYIDIISPFVFKL